MAKMETKDTPGTASAAAPVEPAAPRASATRKDQDVAETPAPRTAVSAAPTANYNVRELLELERKIYDESIEKQRRQLEALQSGALSEYLVQCLPLEKDRDRELEVAKTRLQLNRRNANDLLAFELKQAEDVYQAHCQSLKRVLVDSTQRKRQRILKRLEQLKRGLPLDNDDEGPLKSLAHLEDGGEASPTDVSILATDGSLDVAALERQLERSLAANQTAFNLHHLEHNLPPASAIVADVVEEMERHKAYIKEVTDPDTVCGVVVDPNAGKVWIGLFDVFTVLDHVVLWSCLSDEEFYGQITKVHKDQIDLTLVCGSRVSVSVEQLRKQLCTLRQQEKLDAVDERTPRTPKRKRHRRKHTIGLRQKI